MFHQVFTLVLVFSIYTTSSGQPLPSDRQLTPVEAHVERRILANIRSLVMQLGSCKDPIDQSSNNLSSEIQDLTKRIAAIERSLPRLMKRKKECVDKFENIESEPEVYLIDDQCYYFGQETLTWGRAKAKCQLAEASLLTDPSQEFMDLLLGIPQSHGKNFWIGARKTGGTLKWTTNTVVRQDDERWGTLQPDMFGLNQCVFIPYGRTKWYDDPCDLPYNFVCHL